MAVNEPYRHLPSEQRYGQNAICETLCESKLLLSEARFCFAGSRRSGTMAGLRQFGFYPKSVIGLWGVFPPVSGYVEA